LVLTKEENMSYKLVCIDMDGTLLDSKKNVSQRNLEAIEKSHKLGVKIAICTGRIFTSAKYYGEIIGVKAPIIASNGAYIREKDRDEVIYKSVLGYENCKIIFSVFKKYGIVPHFFTSDSIYTEKLIYFSAYYNEENKKLEKENQVAIKITDQWEKVFQDNELEIIKAVAVDDDLHKVAQAKRELRKISSVEVVSSHNNNFEVMCRDTSKGRGVEILSEFYGFSPEEIICIGDNENDLSMIKFAGLGVAMGNSNDEIKKAADYVTSTNDEDGVAEVLENYIINYHSI